MTYDANRHHRRSIRLPDYDYARAGAYFVTVCAEGHMCLFGDIIDSEMRLNDAGCMVEALWNELPDHYPGAKTDAFVVMPNHIHAVIVLAPDPVPVGAAPRGRPGNTDSPPDRVGAGPRACPDEIGQPQGERGQPRGVAPTDHRRVLSLPDVVHRFKSLTTKRYADGVKQHGWPAFAGRLWQRNYYEHVIRNQESLNRIRQYITNNPASWMLDKENPQAECYGQEERIEQG